MSNKQKTVQTTLCCPDCDSKMPIHRKKGKQKNLHHLKKMYCYTCKAEVNMIEVKDELDIPAWLREENYDYNYNTSYNYSV